MKVTVLKEEGYELALRGLGYSFKDPAAKLECWWNDDKLEKMKKVGSSLVPRGSEERKWIRQVVLWVDINAPRYWWSEFDTYKVGTVAQSESTMHKLAKRPPTRSDFEEDTPYSIFEAFLSHWGMYKNDIRRLKQGLPEGFMQRRLVTLNYEVLNTVIGQRYTHRLSNWQDFIKQIKAQCEHPELINE